MRVLYVTKTSPLDEGGGGEERARAVTQRLAKRGHEVTIISGKTAPHLPTRTTEFGCEIRHVRCLPNILFRFDRASFYLSRYLFSITFLPALVSLLRNMDVDVLVENMTPYPTFAAGVAGIFDVPSVAVVHEHHSIGAYRTYDPMTATLLLAVQQLLRVFDYAAIIVPTEHVRWQFVEWGLDRDRLIVVPNGIDFDTYNRSGIRSDRRKVLTVGRLTKRKGQADVLRAFAEVRRRLEDVHLDVVGAGPRRQELTRLARELNIDDVVTFHGFVSTDQKVELLNEASVFAFASRQEGFGIALLEAMAAGTPVVARSLPVYEAFFIDGRHGVLVSDREEMAEAVVELLRDGERTHEMGRRASEQARQFDWNSVTDRTEQVLFQVDSSDGLIDSDWVRVE